MKAQDVMTQPVVTVAENASIFDAAGLMLRRRISGLPVLDAAGHLTGMVTEGDFLRRSEIGTQRRRPRWIEFLVGPGRLASEYVHTSGRRVNEVMTVDVHTVQRETPLEDVVRLMERYRIKRVPVMDGDALVGIVTRANLMRALVSAAEAVKPMSADDAAIRARLLAELAKQSWAPLDAADVAVGDGVVTLSGVIMDDRERKALCVVAENIAGVKRVEDRLVLLVPGSGIIGQPPIIVGPEDR